jgi:hypothetical protein
LLAFSKVLNDLEAIYTNFPSIQRVYEINENRDIFKSVPGGLQKDTTMLANTTIYLTEQAVEEAE